MKEQYINSKVLLTSIIFTYNHENTIEKCIQSIVNQKTNYHYEIHIWDDCSIDGTSDICREYANKYPDLIRLVVQEENTFCKDGIEHQTYSAIKAVKSKYICIIDGDDYWCDENKIQIALDFLENNPEYNGFAHDTLRIDCFNGTTKSYIHDLEKREIKNPVAFHYDAPFFLTSSRIFRNSDYEKLKILPIDYLFYYYNLSKGPIYYYDKIMAVYNVDSQSTFAGSSFERNHLMFPYKLSMLFNFQKDEFCTRCQKVYDEKASNKSFKYLIILKKIFGIKTGWKMWFIFRFVFKHGIECMDINYVYPRKKVKEDSDTKAVFVGQTLKTELEKRIDCLGKKYEQYKLYNSVENINDLNSTMYEFIDFCLENNNSKSLFELFEKYSEIRQYGYLYLISKIYCIVKNDKVKAKYKKRYQRFLYFSILLFIIVLILLSR